MNAAMNLAAAAGGTAARVAFDRLASWMTQPNQPTAQRGFYNMSPMRNALPPSNPRGRGGRRKRGGRTQGSQPRAGVSTSGSSSIVVRDTEVFTLVEAKLMVLAFNPSADVLPRLHAHEKMYTRYRIKYMNIAYKSGSGTSTVGNVSVAVQVGPKNTQVTTANILSLKPSFFVPAWKNDALTLGKDIDSSRYMICGDTTSDGVSFCLYVSPSAANLGVIQVSYEVEFAFPRPF